MKKKVFVVLLFFTGLLLVQAKVTPQFRFAVDFSANPYMYEHSMAGDANGFNGSLMLGVNLGKVSIGVAMDDYYFAFAASDFHGASNRMRWLLHCYVHPVDWFQMSVGTGGSVLHSAYDYDATGNFAKIEGGIAMRLTLTFTPVRWFSIAIDNRFDLFIDEAVSPFYYGGLQLVFHPFVRWLDLYVEAGGMPWLYESTPVSFTTGLFVWAAGFRIDLTVPGAIGNTKTEYTAAMDRVRSIQMMRKAKAGESIAVNTILFQPDTAQLLSSSYLVLDRIIRILKRRKIITIEIGGHTNNVGNRSVQLRLSAQRAQKVADYLIKKGIATERITTKGYGSSRLLEQGISDSNRRVEIKVLTVE